MHNSKPRLHDSLSASLRERPLRIVPLLLAFALFIGCVLQLALGGRLILRHLLGYWPVIEWGVLILIPTFLVLFLCSGTLRARLRHQFPSAIQRWLIGYPLMSATLTGAVLTAPLGWYTLGAKFLGTPARLTTTVTEVEPLRSGKGCKRHARLELWAQHTKICIADHPLGPELRVGQTLELQGRSTDWAFHLEVARPLPAE